MLVEKVARAINAASCPGREGPFGGYDYGHNEALYGPAPKEGRYVIRDFRTPTSRGEFLHLTNDYDLHEAKFAEMTAHHIARAAIEAVLDAVASELLVVQYDPAPYTAMKLRLAAMRKEAMGE